MGAKKETTNSPFGRAAAILSRREHSTKELQQKLRQRGISSSDVEAVITKCHRLGLVDDRRWAELVVRREVRKGRGPVLIRKLLTFNNIDSDVIDELLAELNQVIQIQLLIAKGRLGGDQRARWRALLRRGFETEAIRTALTD